jgi:geranylgeranyl reductase family protein
MEKYYDVIIVGAGPAGCSCAINIASSNLKIAVIDKSIFPRDKICGGGLSDRSINTLKRMPDGIYTDFLREVDKVDSKGARIFSPNQNYFDVIPIDSSTNGFICKRKDFDNFLFNKLKSYPNIEIINAEIIDVKILTEKVLLYTGNESFSAKIIIGADGANSIISKKITENFNIKRNRLIAIRTIYKNISGFDDKNLAELHFLKEIIPGYFWIFPLGNNEYNVGIGSSKVLLKRNNIILKKLFNQIIASNPMISERFRNAQILSRVEADSLPIGGEKTQIYGNRFLLIGDAACLVDPFTGEGIGNALLSGEIASKVIKSCFLKNNFSENELSNYESLIKKRLQSEFKIHRAMFYVTKNQRFINFLMNKANTNKYFQKIIQEMIKKNQRKWLLFNPFFYLKLIFNK